MVEFEGYFHTLYLLIASRFLYSLIGGGRCNYFLILGPYPVAVSHFPVLGIYNQAAVSPDTLEPISAIESLYFLSFSSTISFAICSNFAPRAGSAFAI